MSHHVENDDVLDLVQAMLGGISTNFRFVSLDADSDATRIQFVLATDNPVDREEIDEIESEFIILREQREGRRGCHVEVVVDKRPVSDLELRSRLIYSPRADCDPAAPPEGIHRRQ